MRVRAGVLNYAEHINYEKRKTEREHISYEESDMINKKRKWAQPIYTVSAPLHAYMLKSRCFLWTHGILKFSNL